MGEDQGANQTGWVISAFKEQTRGAAADLQADYLFVKHSRIVQQKLPPGVNWRWVVYGVKTPQQAQELFDRGVDLVETDFIGEFLANDDQDSDQRP